jgi:hypothetical protein
LSQHQNTFTPRHQRHRKHFPTRKTKHQKNPKEIKGLLETGFEYICQKDELIFLRKRK